MRENNERIRERVLSLIDSEFESDAAFEREMELPEKTVNNWRRGRSASFMKILCVFSASGRSYSETLFPNTKFTAPVIVFAFSRSVPVINME